MILLHCSILLVDFFSKMLLSFAVPTPFIDDLQNIITEYMKTSAFSVGISDLIADTSTKQKIIQSITKQKMEVFQKIQKDEPKNKKIEIKEINKQIELYNVSDSTYVISPVSLSYTRR